MDLKQAIEDARVDALNELPKDLTTEEFITEILKGLHKGQWTTVRKLESLALKHLRKGNSYVHITTTANKLIKNGDVNKTKKAGRIYLQWRDGNDELPG